MVQHQTQAQTLYYVNYRVTNDDADNEIVERSEGLLGIFESHEKAVEAVRDQYRQFMIYYEDEMDSDYYQNSDPFGNWEDQCYAEWHYAFETELPWWHVEFFIEKVEINKVVNNINWGYPID